MRHSAGFPQKHMADAMNISQKTYSELERGLINLTLNHVDQIAEMPKLISSQFYYTMTFIMFYVLRYGSSEVVMMLISFFRNRAKTKPVND